MDFSSFNYFAGTLIGHRPQLRKLMAYGTDGDKALAEAFSHNFSLSVHLRCFLHFRKNIEEKLKSFGIPSAVSQEFLSDIFGRRVGNSFEESLVDSSSVEEVEPRLLMLKDVWDGREKPYAPASGPRFHDFFCRFQANVVKYHMRRDLREAVGLGSPPSIFTTNASESVNATIKQKVDYKKSEWPKFNNEMKQLVTYQREEIIWSLSGRGQYRLKPDFSHYQVPVQEWMKMRLDQRQTIISSFDKASIKFTTVRSVHEVHVEMPGTNSSSCTIPELVISAEDSGITSIPITTLNAMWDKAKDLLSHEKHITSAPGDNEKAHMVLSHSQSAPHLVQIKSSGQYVCDSNCIQWLSSQICSHCLAVAPKNGDLPLFLEWYTSKAENPNITTLSMKGLPSVRGRKGGKVTKPKNRKEVPPIDNYSLGYGIQSSHIGGSVAANVNSGTVINMSDITSHQPPLIQILPSQLISTPFSSVPSTSPFVNVPSTSPFMTTPSTSPTSQVSINLHPFILKLLGGNIRVCQGCRNSLRLSDGQVPPPPFNVVVARMEKRPFRDVTGNVRTPTRPSNAHYHLKLQCTQIAEPSFVPSALSFPEDVVNYLNDTHHSYIYQEFGICY
jgi:hypothetical protein